MQSLVCFISGQEFPIFSRMLKVGPVATLTTLTSQCALGAVMVLITPGLNLGGDGWPSAVLTIGQ